MEVGKIIGLDTIHYLKNNSLSSMGESQVRRLQEIRDPAWFTPEVQLMLET